MRREEGRSPTKDEDEEKMSTRIVKEEEKGREENLAWLAVEEMGGAASHEGVDVLGVLLEDGVVGGNALVDLAHVDLDGAER